MANKERRDADVVSMTDIDFILKQREATRIRPVEIPAGKLNGQRLRRVYITNEAMFKLCEEVLLLLAMIH